MLKYERKEILRKTAYVQCSFLPQGDEILHGQCRCVRDKFYVCTQQTQTHRKHRHTDTQQTQEGH